MFDMPLWSSYLDRYVWDARQAGATDIDLLELFYIQAGMILPKAKAHEILGDTGVTPQPERT